MFLTIFIMNDQQLKIRIKLNQIPQSLEGTHPEETADEPLAVFEKPPFDWRKITAAALLFAAILTGISYGWLAEENDAAITESSPAEETHSISNESLPPDNKIESSDRPADDKSTASPTTAVDIFPAAKPAISTVKPIPKPPIGTRTLNYDVIPPKKPDIVK